MFDEAIILAGGMGTRLSDIVKDKPKPMADINGKPFLEYLVNYLAVNNITHIIMSVGYKSEMIIDYFGEKFNNIKISYAVENYPLGTGGGILLAIRKTKKNNIFIINGDTFFNIKLQRLADFHREKKPALTIALKKVKDGSRYGSIIIDKNNQIAAFTEKNKFAKEILINGGIYMINKHMFLNAGLPEKFSFEKDYLEKYYKKDNFFGLEFDDYFIDIGLPSTYKMAQSDFFNKLCNK